MARPEEPLEAVSSMPGDHVDVQVRDALADAIVDGHEGAICPHALFHGASEELGVPEERGDLLGREIGEGWTMSSGHKQAMAGEERAVVKEGHARIVLQDKRSGALTAYNLAEDARGWHRSEDDSCLSDGLQGPKRHGTCDVRLPGSRLSRA
jgi:hypothetical protein